ncbi:hypothetical protein [Tessaracoccus antarcticus]|nr:hypothetical protein [Tessaracoccus antarcticus]
MTGNGVLPSPSPPETPISSPVDPPSPSAGEPTDDVFVPEDFDWGEFPPKSFENLKDLADPVFPETVLTYTLESSSPSSSLSIGSYVDPAAVATMQASVYSSPFIYKTIVEGLVGPEYHGRPVCGRPESSPEQVTCVMIGQLGVLSVVTPAPLPIEDVATFTEAIYDLL